MGRARGGQQGNRKESRLSLQAEVLVVHDPQLRRRQAKAIRSFLLSLAARVGEAATSDGRVGAEKARNDGLDGLIGPLEAEVVRVVWAAEASVSVREVLGGLNEGRGRPLAYTTVLSVMTRLVRKHVLARSRHGRADLYRAVAADAASIAVSRVLGGFGETAIERFVEQVCSQPKLRPALRAAISRRW